MSDTTKSIGLRGDTGAGGSYAIWPEGTQDAAAVPFTEFQYSGMAHQAEAGISGMWLFLATELLFFGGLFLIAAIMWERYAPFIAVASRRTEFGIGSINTVLLFVSSGSYSWGVSRAQLGDNRGVRAACIVTSMLGLSFLILKGFEWNEDFSRHLVPGPGFAITGDARGPAEIFWSFYFLATLLHGLHMIVGVILVAWIGLGAQRGRFSQSYATPVEAVGLYWSFVDMMWLCLYPLIYLPGFASR
jgi:cytochrome c oxidase subunit 3